MAVEEVVDRLILAGRGERAHAGGGEEGVEVAHEGEGFDVSCGAIIEDVTDEEFGQAEGTEDGVDDDAGDGAEVGVEPAVAVGRGQGGEAEDLLAEMEREGWEGEDGDGGELRGQAGVEGRGVADDVDGGEGGGAAGAVVEAGEGGVVAGGAGEEGEVHGGSGGKKS